MASHSDINVPSDLPNQSDDVQADDRVVNTQGGDYAEGDIDKRQGTFVEGNLVITEEQSYKVSGRPNPYLGLGAFTYDDQGKFAGRDDEIAASLALLTTPGVQCTLLFINGASGSGKSSFAQAGLLPALESHYRQRHFAVQRAVFRPSRLPLASLIDALQQLQLPASQLASETLLKQPEYLAQFVQHATTAQQINLIVLDQFEELFTQSEPAQRDALFTILEQLPPFPTLRTHIIVTMRSDYLPELFQCKALYEIAKSGVDLRAMEASKLEQAIQRPLQKEPAARGKCFQPALLQRLVLDAAGDATKLPLLQVTLTDLWQDGSLQLSAYQGLANAIKRRADVVYAYRDYDGLKQKQRVPEEQAAILNLFLELVRAPLDDKQHYVRWRRRRADLTQGDPQRERFIDDLATARLLRTDRETIQDNGQEREVKTVDIIHEALLSGWPTLAGAIERKQETLRQRVRFDLALNDWLAHKQHDDYLLMGVRLAEVEALKQNNDGVFQRDGAQEFFARSIRRRDEERERQVRRVRLVVAGLSLLLLLVLLAAVAAGWFGLQAQRGEANARNNAATAQAEQQRADIQAATAAAERENAKQQTLLAEHEGRISRARELAALSQTARSNSYVQRALLLSIEGVNATAADEPVVVSAEQALRDNLAILNSRGLSGHKDAIRGLAISSDGKTLTTGSNDGTIRLWNLQDLNPYSRVRVLNGHKGGVANLLMSSDGHLLVSGDDDGIVKIWDLTIENPNTTVKTLFAGTERITALSINYNGNLVVSASYDGIVIVWDLRAADPNTTRRILHGHEQNIGFERSVQALALSPDAHILVTGGNDATVRIWDLTTSDPNTNVRVLRGHEDRITNVVFRPDGYTIITSSYDTTIRVWNLSALDANADVRILRGHEGPVFTIALSRDGNILASGSYDEVSISGDQTARVWNLEEPDPSVNPIVLSNIPNGVSDLAISPDAHALYTGNILGQLRVYDLTNHSQPASPRVLLGHEGPITGLALSSDGQVLISASSDATARIWSFSSPPAGPTAVLLHGREDKVDTSAISENDKAFAIGKDDGSVLLWKLQPKSFDIKPITLRGHKDEVRALVFSSDGKKLFTASDDNTIRLWDLTVADTEASVQVLEGGVSYMAFSANGRFFVTPGTLELSVFDLQAPYGGDSKRDYSGLTPTQFVSGAMAISDNGRVVAASTGRQVNVWKLDNSTGKSTLVNVIEHETTVWKVALSADGSTLATGDNNGIAQIWDLTSNSPKSTVRSIIAHSSSVKTLLLSASGQTLVTSGDNVTRIWDLTIPNPNTTVRDLRFQYERVTPLKFRPDTQSVVTVSQNGTVRLWKLDSRTLIATACQAAGRNFSLLEWQQYFSAKPYHRTCSQLPDGIGASSP